MMTLVALYTYIMPYEKPYVNLLESFVLADLAVLLMVALTDQFKVGCVYTYKASYIVTCCKLH